MSDPKRANLITVGAPKSAKKIVNETVRLTINLVESNESKYPELNYKELVIAEEQRRKRLENGKTGGLDPFSDNDEDVERVAKKFEQKYGNNSPYRKKKRRSKNDDFADIGAGYDENDSFIDNTHGYDEMIPPNIDTIHGGFYINCGSLEFKTVPNDESVTADEPRRNKRRISSSSSEEESSDSSSGSDSQDTKDPKEIANGAIHSHKTEHRKKKNKKADKQKVKKVHRADSSAANSGKQTSDENHPEGEGESVDSRTSHSDSLTSKPAPSSENAITSDSSRDTESKADSELPAPVTQVLEALEASVTKQRLAHPATLPAALLATHIPHIQRLEVVLLGGASPRAARESRARAAAALGVSRAALLHRIKSTPAAPTQTSTDNAHPPPASAAPSAPSTATNKNKRKLIQEDDLDVSVLSDDQRENMMVETIRRLMDLIEEFKPSMFANYNLECERVREEKKKLTSDGATVEKRLPKRRFPWCHRSRSLLARITKLAGSQQAGAMLLADKILPLFPKGFVRMPTLMRQANIGKEVKVPEIKRQRLGSSTQIPLTLLPPNQPPHNLPPQNLPPQNAPPQNIPPSIPTPPSFPEPIQFPSSLTVTATNVKTSPETETQTIKDVNLGNIMNSFAVSKDLIVEREKSEKNEEMYIPPNNIGSITITPVPSQGSRKEKKTEKTQSAPKDKPSSQVQKTSVTDTRQPSSGHKTNVTDNRLPSSIQKTIVTDNRHASSILKPSVLDNRQPSSAQLAVMNDDRHSSIQKQSDKRQPSSTQKTTVTENRQPSVAEKPSLIRVKSPAALNESYKKDAKTKKPEKSYPNPEKNHPNPKDRRVDTPLQIDTNFQTAKKEPSPKNKDTSPRSKDSVSQKQIESLRVKENNIPRPALVPVHHSPTFAKPDKRPEKKKEVVDIKKKKEILIISDLDPLSEPAFDEDPVAIDDSSSDVEVIEEVIKSDKSETSDVPLKDNKVPKNVEESDDDIDKVMRNIREMEHSQEPTKFNSNSYSGVIDNSIAKHGISHHSNRNRNRDNFAERTSLNKTDGCNGVTG